MKDLFRYGLGFRTDADRLGVYWSDDAVALALVNRSGTLERTARWTPGPGTRLAEEIKRYAAGLSSPPAVVLAFSQQRVAARVLRLPSRSPAEIFRMAELDVQRRLPLSREEFLAGHDAWPFSAHGAWVSTLLVRREDLAAPLHVLSEAGLGPCRVISELHTFHSFLPADGEGRLLVELKPGAMTLSLFKGNRAVIARSLPLPSGPAFGVERVLTECRASLDAWKGQGFTDGNEKVLCLDFHPETSALWEPVKRGLPRPVDSFDAVAQMEFGRAFPEQLIDGAVLKAWGAALYRGAFNFFPAADSGPLARRRRKAEKVLFCSLGSLLLTVGLGAAAGHYHSRREYTRALDQRLSLVSPPAAALQAKLSRLKTREAKRAERGSFWRILSDAGRVVPGSASFRSVSYERGQSLAIQGTATSLAAALDAAEALRKTNAFRSVTTRSSSVSRVQGREVAHYDILCEWAPAGSL